MNELSKELNEYLKLLFRIDDPIVYSVLFIMIIFVLLILIFYYVIFPLRKKYMLETHALELKHTRLMALFAELDPDPVIRTDREGKIIFTNDSAKTLIKGETLEGRSISEIINNIDFPIADYISQNKSKQLIYKNNSRYFSVLFRGISSLKIAQFYFHDTTDKIQYENKLRSLSNNLQNMIEEERRRIARELHDGIGQNLLLLKMNLVNNFKNILPKEKPDFNFHDSTDLLDNTIFELKNIIYGLKPSVLEEMGLGAALASLIKKISDEGPLHGSLQIKGFDQRLDIKLELSIYRIIQEAINNIIKHSEASSFMIRLENTNKKIKLFITDDGKGIGSNKLNHNGFGLLNIQERIRSYGGDFKIGPRKDNGTFLKIEIPVGDNG